ncbi:MAG: HAMP domain-containing histidine kinase [Ignavibacteria bacterium]|nr:HAMP domain-containing histidine kinase [Ignavibacteria bacterium]
MLRGDLEEDPRSAPSFAIISQELTRLQNLVQRSLDIGSFGRMTKEKVELRALFDEILATFGVQLQNRKLSCDIDIPRCSMLADREKLRAAISNLVNNAIDAAGPEGRIRVTGALHPDGTRIDCSVTDNGPGIPGTVNVFQPFYTTKTGGTGLGLPNARRIFEQHGGTLTLESSEPGKTVFAFSLPLEAVS